MSANSTASNGVLSWKAGLIVLVIGIFSFSAFIVLSAFAPDLEDKDMAGLHAFSKSALGYNFSVQLLEKTGYQIDISQDPNLLKDKTGYGILVLTPEGSRDLSEMEDINYDRADPILIVLPKRWGFADRNIRSHQARVGELSLNSVSRLLQPVDDSFGMRRVHAAKEVDTAVGRLPVTFNDRTQLITSGPIDTIIGTDEGTIFGQVTGRNIYVLSDPELMNTHGLAHIDNARLMLMMFEAITENDKSFPITFDTTINGFERSRNLLQLLFKPPLLGATLFAFAASILLGWAAFVRFGREPVSRPEFATGRASLIASTAGLFEQTAREHLLAKQYADIVDRLTVTELGYPDDLTPQQVQDILKTIETSRREKGIQVSDKPSAENIHTAGQFVNFACAYHTWKRDMSDERK